jgi:hypothetical protein
MASRHAESHLPEVGHFLPLETVQVHLDGGTRTL